MNMKKVKEWMELANQCATGDFWGTIMDSNDQDDPLSTTPESWSPPVDIFSTSDETFILVELPGIRKEELDLTMIGDSLIIKGMKNNRIPIEDSILSERYTGTFERSIRLPYPVQWNTVSAKLAEGMLVLRFPLPLYREAKISVE
ncbi:MULTISPECIES: Hsp20/alpha crystallin family protein [Paenibacillus]|uniref:Small heat shock protein HSP20 n=1 Tax=Paenibacillus naphthalenovorans TaxID=162209 RepID=A0A0U2WA22_9BACL|nr:MULTISPECIES: Hsp20/alpha crystallin family protein [Paenibacillus]ALS24301.1 small heat shock protein HSP20 [Paenibacillus naphthalenovorans]NTZ20401.1 Hsp20/alpha crystallin family protein [Paenibacillus sp. JMULE4]GCL73808.1 Hsp20/alpha crystallin family protein [Paenibacillus naphthalenovorans]SDI52986.1 HSP20 family protein [Paenibacillus naphthalenovorans]